MEFSERDSLIDTTLYRIFLLSEEARMFHLQEQWDARNSEIEELLLEVEKLTNLLALPNK